jgi:hypothetical protein
MNAQPDDEVIRLIELSNMCQVFDSLPAEGGILDQDYYTIKALYYIRAAQADREEVERKRQEAFDKAKGRRQ